MTTYVHILVVGCLTNFICSLFQLSSSSKRMSGMCNVWTLTLSLLTKVNEDMRLVCVGLDRSQNSSFMRFVELEILPLKNKLN